MPAFRYIDPDIRRSESISKLTYRQRDLWIGLILTADDQGRREADLFLVRSDVWPREDISLDEIKSDVDVLAEMDFILIYKIGNKEYIQIINWSKYQARAEWLGPSKFPPPSGWEDRYRYHGKGNIIHKSDNWSTCQLPNKLPSNDVNDDVNDDSDRDSEEVQGIPPVENGEYSQKQRNFLSKEDLISERGYIQATGHPFIPGHKDEQVATRKKIIAIAAMKSIDYSDKAADKKIADALRPYWIEWDRRKYSWQNTAWIDWAAAGRIPEKKLGKPPDTFKQQSPEEIAKLKAELRKNK